MNKSVFGILFFAAGCGGIGIDHVADRVVADGGAGAGGPRGLGGAFGDPTTGGATTGGMPATGGAASVVHCNELPYLAAAPVLDGQVESGLYVEAVTPVGWRNSTTPLPSGHALSYAAAWREDGLYFYLEVTDPDRNPPGGGDEVYMGDGVELYVDHDGSFDTDPPFYDVVGTRQFFVVAPADDVSPGDWAQIRIPIGTYNDWVVPSWISTPTPSGYVVEAFIGAAELDLSSLALAAGQSVGLDLAHNVSVPPGDTGVEGNRLSQYFLRISDEGLGGDLDYPYNNERAFCSAILLPP